MARRVQRPILPDRMRCPDHPPGTTGSMYLRGPGAAQIHRTVERGRVRALQVVAAKAAMVSSATRVTSAPGDVSRPGRAPARHAGSKRARASPDPQLGTAGSALDHAPHRRDAQQLEQHGQGQVRGRRCRAARRAQPPAAAPDQFGSHTGEARTTDGQPAPGLVAVGHRRPVGCEHRVAVVVAPVATPVDAGQMEELAREALADEARATARGRPTGCSPAGCWPRRGAVPCPVGRRRRRGRGPGRSPSAKSPRPA